jgi:hypothetical protein
LISVHFHKSVLVERRRVSLLTIFTVSKQSEEKCEDQQRIDAGRSAQSVLVKENYKIRIFLKNYDYK